MPVNPTYKIYAVKFAGPFVRSRSLMMWLRDFDVKIEANHYMWCAQGSDDTILVDAGVSPEIARAREITSHVNPADLLARIGVRADEVKHVILTHLHWDHATGVTMYPRAKFYVQEQEYRFWLEDPLSRRPPFANPFTSDDSYKKYLSKLEGTDRLVLLQGDREILPGIECLLAPGHTPGLQAVAINTENGTAILGSDCAHLFANYEEDWPSSLIFDLRTWFNSYDKLRARVSSPHLLFPGHDPLMSSNFPCVAEDITRLA